MIATIGHLGSTVDVRYDAERKLYVCSNCALSEDKKSFEADKPWTMIAHLVQHRVGNDDVVPVDAMLCLEGDTQTWAETETEKTDA